MTPTSLFGNRVMRQSLLFQFSRQGREPREVIERHVVILRKRDEMVHRKLAVTALVASVLLLLHAQYPCNFGLAFIGILSQVAQSLVNGHFGSPFPLIMQILHYNRLIVLISKPHGCIMMIVCIEIEVKMMQTNPWEKPQDWETWKNDLRRLLNELQVDRFELDVMERLMAGTLDVSLGFMDFRDYMARILSSLRAQVEQLERLYEQIPSPNP